MKLFGQPDYYDRSESFRRAEKFRSRGRVKKAIREYEKVLAVDPTDLEVHTKIAPLYIRAGRKIQAKASLKRVIAWHEKEGFVEKAIAMLRLALTLDRRDLALSLNLANLYLGKDLKADALRLLEGARRTFRRKRFRQVSLVRLFWRAGRRRDARERLWQMESQWARRKNRKCWRKTRWLLCRRAPSLSTCWGYFISLFITPVPYRPEKRHHFAS
ncbi:MAG: tetratricopeptide repeat protein [Candidatus Methylomirabilales bacterium]